MNWSDERYVRLYIRDTVTWKRWTWEARALFALLLRKVDRSGVLDTGTDDKIDALALMLDVPLDVASRAVEQWLSAGTVVATSHGFTLPSFIAAQEARQSDRLRQAESRSRRSAATLQDSEAACHTPSHGVTASHTVSQHVTPAVPCRAVPSLDAGVAEATPPPKKSKATKAPDSRHAPLVARLTEVFRVDRGWTYPFDGGRDGKAVANLLSKAEPDALVAAWGRALAHSGFPSVSTLSELNTHLARFLGASTQATAEHRPSRLL